MQMIMSLYINHGKHKDIYKNETDPKAPNQKIFMHNHMAEMIKEQKNINKQLLRNFNHLKSRYIQQENRGEEILYQLQGWREGQIDVNELKLKMEQQLELQKKVQLEISKQVDNQKEISKRLDNQEALAEKILRQMDYLRSLVYERTNNLTEKIEDGYQLTAAYMYHITINRDQMPLSFLLFQKQIKNRNDSPVT